MRKNNVTNTNRSSNISTTLSVVSSSIPGGGVSLESGRGFRGSVSINGVRSRTTYFKTRLGAVRALNRLKRELLMR